MSIVVGTAGHIDHGKTALLRALTGIDADRLPEERRRGMTIDVGYAHLRLPDGEELDFVDVPGHDRLVGNMLVGAGEIDAALFVIAADDGPRAQTIEHLELLDALGIGPAICAITKVDLVDSARIEAVRDAVVRLLDRTTLAGSPVIAVSSTRGQGLDDLRIELVHLRDRVRSIGRRGDGGPARLAIDRAFTIRGRGLVVTGSLRGGPLVRGESLRVVPGPGSVRARELQVHSATVEGVEDGGRVAINVAEVDREGRSIARGDTLTGDPTLSAPADFLALLRPPSQLAERAISWPPRAGEPFRIHSGTAQVDAVISRGRRDQAETGEGRLVVRLRLGAPIALAIGDPFALRRPSPPATIAAGVVLDVEAPSGPSRRRIDATRLTALGSAAAGRPTDATTLAARLELHGALPAPRSGSDRRVRAAAIDAHAGWLLSADVEGVIARAAVTAVTEAPPAIEGARLADVRREAARILRREVRIDARAAAGVAEDAVDRLILDGRLVRDGDRLRLPGQAPPAPDAATVASMERLVAALDRPDPPPLSEAARAVGCPADAVRRLEAEGRIVTLDEDLAYAERAFAALQDHALRLAGGGALTPATFRDATGTTRKYVLAVLEELDRRGVLARTSAGHIRGPRAPR